MMYRWIGDLLILSESPPLNQLLKCCFNSSYVSSSLEILVTEYIYIYMYMVYDQTLGINVEW